MENTARVVDFLLEVDDEEQIEKSMNELSYPAVTLTNASTNQSFYFNKRCTKYLNAPKMTVSKGKIGNEQYICIRNGGGDRAFKPHYNYTGGGFTISAASVLSAIGMRGCRDYTVRGRKCYAIKDGIAFKVYE